jgi:hypothetical protein
MSQKKEGMMKIMPSSFFNLFSLAEFKSGNLEHKICQILSFVWGLNRLWH